MIATSFVDRRRDCDVVRQAAGRFAWYVRSDPLSSPWQHVGEEDDQNRAVSASHISVFLSLLISISCNRAVPQHEAAALITARLQLSNDFAIEVNTATQLVCSTANVTSRAMA